MPAPDNTHSRVVAWLKIILPLLALALLSTVFLVAKRITPSQTLPYSDVDVGELARENRVGQPHYSGVTSDGASVSISAAAIRPDTGESDIASGNALEAEIDLPVGTRITLSAADGAIDGRTKIAELGGGVLITTSTGYRIETTRLAAYLNATKLVSDGAIDAIAPMGSITAGHMEVSRDAETGAYLLVFNEGVKLVYQPSK